MNEENAVVCIVVTWFRIIFGPPGMQSVLSRIKREIHNSCNVVKANAVEDFRKQ